MNELKVLESGEKFAHTSVGSLHNFDGKQFVKDITGATSCEISFGSLPSGVQYRSSTVTKQTRRTM